VTAAQRHTAGVRAEAGEVAAARIHRVAFALSALVFTLGACGDGTGPSRAPFVQLSAGGSSTCGLTAEGAAYCWGGNSSGQIGDGTTVSRTTPTAVGGILRFRTIVVGATHVCGLTLAGSAAVCWGENSFGQLGDETTTTRPYSAAVTGGLVFQTLSAHGGWHTCGLTVTGAVYCWGANGSGQVNGGNCGVEPHFLYWICNPFNRPYPVLVRDASGSIPQFRAIEAGGRHTCGVTTDGTTFCWGGNEWGQLGDTTGTYPGLPPYGPVPLPASLTLRTAAVGGEHTCALDAAGATFCWGANGSGGLGIGALDSSRFPPTPVVGGLTFQALALGDQHSCGRRSDGSVYCWGNNAEGAVGDGTQTNRTSPVATLGGLTFASITAGARHTCGLTVEGEAWCWGDDYFGQLGDGRTGFQTTPVRVR